MRFFTGWGCLGALHGPPPASISPRPSRLRIARFRRGLAFSVAPLRVHALQRGPARGLASAGRAAVEARSAVDLEARPRRGVGGPAHAHAAAHERALAPPSSSAL